MKNKREAGFTYIDVMCAIVILLVGILALLSAITGAIFQSKGQEIQLSAKQIATSTMESIMSAKETDTDRLGWKAVGNVGSNPINGVPQGIFVTGLQPVRADAGPDEIIGTADDTGAIIAGLQRQIVITDQCDPERPSPSPVCATPGQYDVKVRSVVVTITYYVGAVQRQEQLTTILTDYYIAN